MVGVARIELATPAMSTQCLSRKPAENCRSTWNIRANEPGTDTESSQVLPE